jgi:hypothetical protein
MLDPVIAGAPVFVTPVLGSIAAAAANTALIQAALTRGGRVDLRGQGVAYMNATLVIGDATELTLEGGLTVRQAPGTGSSLLRTAASLATPVAVTLSWSAGRLCTVSWPAHGLQLGQSVWLQGANAPAGQTAYLGVFPIVTVQDANTLVVRLRRSPSAAPTLTVTAVKANKGVSVGGEGLWDFDGANNPSAQGVETQALVMVGVDQLTADVKVANALKYCLTLSAVANWRAGLRTPVTFSDGIKVYGPAFDGEVLRVSGAPGDDFMSLQPKEATGFLNYPLSEGDIIGVRGGALQQDGPAGASTVGMFTVYAHGTYALDEVSISGVRGENGYRAVNIRNSGDQSAGQFGRISVTQIGCRALYPVYVDAAVSGATLTGDRLELQLENSSTNGDTTNNLYQEHVHLGGSLGVKTLKIALKLTDPTYGAASTSYAVNMGGSARQLILDESHFAPAANARFLNIGNSSQAITVDEVVFRGGYYACAHLVDPGGVASANFVNTPEITLDRTRVDGTGNTSVVGLYGAANLSVSGAVLNNCNLGLVRGNGSYACTVRSTGTRLLGTSTWITAPTGSPVFTVQSEEVQADVTAAYIARANGARLYNTNATAGSLGQAGVVDCTGAAAGSWKLRATPSQTY